MLTMIQRLRYLFLLFLLGLLIFPSLSPLQANITTSDTTYTGASFSKILSILDTIDQSMIEEFLTDIVSFGPRMTGTYACHKTGEYIFDQFEDFGLITSIHNWSRFGNRYNPRWFNGFNVIGELPGTLEEESIDIIFTAHYDSVKVSPGADDDGSGVAAVLATAKVLSSFEFSHTIRFVCFSGEEQGLLGSKEYVKKLYEQGTDNVIINFNADGIGHASTEESAQRFRVWGTEDVSWLVDQIEILNQVHGLNFDLDKRTLREDGRGGSDYYSFVRYGFDAIAFFESEWNPHWHTADDTLDHINFEYLTRNTKLIAISIAWLADSTLSHPFVSIESPKRGMFYFEGRQKKQLDDSLQGNIRTVIINDIWIWTEVFIDESLIEKVEFYSQGRLLYIDTDPPYKFNLNTISFFPQRLEVVAYHVNGETARDWMDIFFLNLFRRI